MKRVNRGEDYWYLSGVYNVERGWDNYGPASNLDFVNDNYFHTKEEAETMARKLRAVLKGADVIEMPSEDVIKGKAIDIALNICGDDYWRDCEEAAIRTTEWLKSKIVK